MKIEKGKIHSINFSQTKGTAKTPIEKTKLVEDFGLEGDAHGGPGTKQVSLLAMESIRKQKRCPKAGEQNGSLKPGDFAENITTEGLNLAALKIGDKFLIAGKVILEISKIGKECHRYCAIYQQTGDCLMPREGIFAKVVKGGEIVRGDEIEAAENV